MVGSAVIERASPQKSATAAVSHGPKADRTIAFFVFYSFAALPAAIPALVPAGALSVYVFEVLAVLALLRLRSHTAERLTRRWIPLVCLVAYASITGLLLSANFSRVTRDAHGLLDLALAVPIGYGIVRRPEARLYLRSLEKSLVFSALCTMGSAALGYPLQGRAGSTLLYTETGQRLAINTVGTTRYLTGASVAATAYLCLAVAASLAGHRARRFELLAAGASVTLVVLSYSRYQLLAVAVALAAAIVALIVTGRGTALIRRSGRLTGVIVLGTVALVLISGVVNLGVGSRLSAYQSRVFDGLSSSARARDSSAQDRQIEDSYMKIAIGNNPVRGTGFGYAYKPTTGLSDQFSANDGQYYAHNYYLWILMKAGTFGFLLFCAQLLGGVTSALKAAFRAGTDSERVASVGALAVLGGLSACLVYAPLVNGFPNSMFLGVALGTAFGVNRQRGIFKSARPREGRKTGKAECA